MGQPPREGCLNTPAMRVAQGDVMKSQRREDARRQQFGAAAGSFHVVLFLERIDQGFLGIFCLGIPAAGFHGVAQGIRYRTRCEWRRAPSVRLQSRSDLMLADETGNIAD